MLMIFITIYNSDVYMMIVCVITNANTYDTETHVNCVYAQQKEQFCVEKNQITELCRKKIGMKFLYEKYSANIVIV